MLVLNIIRQNFTSLEWATSNVNILKESWTHTHSPAFTFIKDIDKYSWHDIIIFLKR